jgi:hypothetical protein
MQKKPTPNGDPEAGAGCGPLLGLMASLIFAAILLIYTPTGDSRRDRFVAMIQSVKVGDIPVLALAVSAFFSGKRLISCG